MPGELPAHCRLQRETKLKWYRERSPRLQVAVAYCTLQMWGDAGTVVAPLVAANQQRNTQCRNETYEQFHLELL
jgi:hypothetical protein